MSGCRENCMLAICFAFCWQSWCEKQHSLIKQCQKNSILPICLPIWSVVLCWFSCILQEVYIYMAKWSSFVKNFTVTWFLRHFNRTSTNLSEPEYCHSVQDFPNKDLFVLWPEWICSVQVVWDLIRKGSGTRCACPAPLLHLHTVNPVHSSCPACCVCSAGSRACSAHVRQYCRTSPIYWVRMWLTCSCALQLH